jgi:hypothetical protein
MQCLLLLRVSILGAGTGKSFADHATEYADHDAQKNLTMAIVQPRRNRALEVSARLRVREREERFPHGLPEEIMSQMKYLHRFSLKQ